MVAEVRLGAVGACLVPEVRLGAVAETTEGLSDLMAVVAVEVWVAFAKLVAAEAEAAGSG